MRLIRESRSWIQVSIGMVAFQGLLFLTSPRWTIDTPMEKYLNLWPVGLGMATLFILVSHTIMER